jgi:hypothetical protein
MADTRHGQHRIRSKNSLQADGVLIDRTIDAGLWKSAPQWPLRSDTLLVKESVNGHYTRFKQRLRPDTASNFQRQRGAAYSHDK